MIAPARLAERGQPDLHLAVLRGLDAEFPGKHAPGICERGQGVALPAAPVEREPGPGRQETNRKLSLQFGNRSGTEPASWC